MSPRSVPASEGSLYPGDAGGERNPASLADAQTGLKALVTVARHLGLDWSEERLYHVYARTTEPNAAELSGIARKEGLKSGVEHLDWERLGNLGSVTPFIARLSNGSFVIVVRTPSPQLPGAAVKDDSVILFNPRSPQYPPFSVTREKFEEHWTGEVVLLKRSFSLTDSEQPFGLGWFVPKLWKQRSLLANVGLAALVMHCLALAVPLFIQIVIDRVLVNFAVSTLIVISVGVFLAILFDACFNWLRGYFLLRASSRIDIRLARDTFQHLLALPIGFFEHALAGVMTKHMQQASQIREFLTGRLLGTLLDLPALIVFLPLLFFYSAKLTVLVLGVTLVLASVIALLLRPYRRRLKRLYAAEAGRQSLLVESIHGIRTIKSLNMESRLQQNWENAAAEAVGTYVEVGKLSLVANTLTQFVERSMTIAIIIVGTFIVFTGDMTVGALVAFNMLAARVVAPLLQVVGLLNSYQEVLMSVDMLGEIMNARVERRGGRGLTPSPLHGDIVAEMVTFRYPGVDRPALNAFSMHIPAGSMVGVVGRSGSGKTTMSALLQGHYIGSEGTIRIDGHDIRDIDLAYLRGQTGVVPQDPFLFRGTVKENISLAHPAASFEEVVAAAKLAGADEFIRTLPRRYDTLLEEGAVNLSGGQKQRISIARALLRKPRIIIFDEATSALDPESEAIVVANLRRMAAGRTAIIISHRLQTIRRADIIIVMDEGAVSAQGTHSELMRVSPLYRELWRRQVDAPP